MERAGRPSVDLVDSDDEDDEEAAHLSHSQNRDLPIGVILGLLRDYIGRMEEKMETTTSGLGLSDTLLH